MGGGGGTWAVAGQQGEECDQHPRDTGVQGQTAAWGGGGTDHCLDRVQFSGHRAACQKPVQNGIECKLWLKDKGIG